MKVRIITTILLFSIFSLTACINIYTTPPDSSGGSSPGTTGPSTPSEPEVQPVQFENRTWVLEKYGKASSLQNVISGKEVSARFDSSSGKVSGKAGCNSYSASYTRSVNKLSLSNMTTTLMNCPSPSGLMAQESAFKDALMNAEICRMAGNKLEINCTLNRLLIFAPK